MVNEDIGQSDDAFENDDAVENDAAVENDDDDPDRYRIRPRSSETTFGTGKIAPGQPDDVTLQGTGNSAPRKTT